MHHYLYISVFQLPPGALFYESLEIGEPLCRTCLVIMPQGEIECGFLHQQFLRDVFMGCVDIPGDSDFSDLILFLELFQNREQSGQRVDMMMGIKMLHGNAEGQKLVDLSTQLSEYTFRQGRVYGGFSGFFLVKGSHVV